MATAKKPEKKTAAKPAQATAKPAAKKEVKPQALCGHPAHFVRTFRTICAEHWAHRKGAIFQA